VHTVLTQIRNHIPTPILLQPRFAKLLADHDMFRQPVDGTGNFALVNSGSSQVLANNVDLSTGRTVVTVPRVNGGNGYTIVREYLVDQLSMKS
jgi:hypothetical protein